MASTGESNVFCTLEKAPVMLVMILVKNPATLPAVILMAGPSRGIFAI